MERKAPVACQYLLKNFGRQKSSSSYRPSELQACLVPLCGAYSSARSAEVCFNNTRLETLVHYETPPHLQRAFTALNYAQGDFPVSEAMHRDVLSLPIGPHLDELAILRACDAVNEAIANLEGTSN